MKAKASITYEVITDESAENGDMAEHGWWLPGGWEHPLEDTDGWHDDVLAEAQAGEFDLEVGRAVRAAVELGAIHEIQILGDGLSARSVDAPCDRACIEDGEHRFYWLHVKGCSPGTLARIARVLRG